MKARSLNTERAGLSGICRLTTVALAFGLALFLNIGVAFAQTPSTPTAADDDKPDPCAKVVFSSTDNEEMGCSVAAALHYGGTSLDAVRAHVARYSAGKRGQKWLERFNKNLRGLTKDIFWAAFSHLFSRDDIKSWKDEELVEKLAEAATRLDVLHQHRRTDNKVRALRELIKAAKGVAPAPPPEPSKKDCKKADPPAPAQPPADPTPTKKVP